jgi:signal transduction histidine kinase
VIERPAVLIGADGAVVLANERFRGLCEKHGAAAVEMGALLVPESNARLMLLLGRTHPAGGEGIELVLRSGNHVSARAGVPEAGDGSRLLLVVVDQPPGGGLSGASTLRHDIAGPLTAILGTAELALLRGGDRLAPDVRDTLLQIIDHCGRMTEVLQRSRAAGRAGDGGGG